MATHIMLPLPCIHLLQFYYIFLLKSLLILGKGNSKLGKFNCYSIKVALINACLFEHIDLYRMI